MATTVPFAQPHGCCEGESQLLCATSVLRHSQLLPAFLKRARGVKGLTDQSEQSTPVQMELGS